MRADVPECGHVRVKSTIWWYYVGIRVRVMDVEVCERNFVRESYPQVIGQS